MMSQFECGREPINVTSMHRPDISWRFTDSNGHEHRWHVASVDDEIDHPVAERYNPSVRYVVPSLVWVKTGEYFDEEGEPHEEGYDACRDCGEKITPRYTADDTEMYIPGLLWCRIDGQLVSKEEFERRLKEEQDSAVK